jgi:Carboxypeptidase regulatory-like domain/TonB dependent receptor
MDRHPLSVRRAIGAAAAACALAALAASPVHAQAVRGTLLGSINDTSSSAVPGATVTATDQGTSISSTTVTNQDGFYTFPNLKDGIYRVEAELTGFKKVVRENVRVDVNTTIRVDLTLEAGAITEVLTVSADPPPLQSDRADTGRIIQGEQIAAMPLGFGRNFQGMIATVPGASRPFRPHSVFFNPQDTLSSNVNGQSRLANNVQVEGVDNNHRTGLLTVIIPSAEALETVSITTSNYDAEFGRAGGAVTNVTLKSGTNQFKGSGFYFGNTEATIATNPFVDRTLPKERQKADSAYHQGGFTLGGPIVRNRLFFFGDYIRTSDKTGRINRFTLPTEAMRNGDFSASSVPIYDPLTGNPATGEGRTQFPGNVIPANRISPIARQILASVPLPNLANAALGAINYQDATSLDRTTDGFDVKVNYQLSPRDQLSLRYSYQRPVTTEGGNYGVFGGPYQGGFIGTGTNLTQSTAGNWTRTMTDTFVMDARFGVSTYHNEALSAGTGLNTAAEIGIPGANLDTYTSGMTSINLQGHSNPTVGYSASLPWDRGETTYTAALVMTKLWGNHTVKFGGDYRHNYDYLLQTQDQGGPRGFFTFNGGQTGIPTNAATQNNVGNALAAFLLDRPSSAGRDLAVIDRPGTVHSAMFTFIHDKWQVSPKLTLDLGLRHEYYTPFVGTQAQGGLSNYDPVTNHLLVSGYGDVEENLGVEQTWRNFNPRLGLSYRLTDRQVLRAGYGASTIPFGDNTYAFNFPVKQNNQFNSANAFVPPTGISMAAGFPAPVVAQIPSNGRIDAGADPRLRNASYVVVPTDLQEGLLHSWNVAYQRELPHNFTAEIAYVGNHGQDIIQRLDLNASLVPGSNNDGRPQFAQFGRTASTTAFLPYHTDYHSMQVKVDRRFRNNFLITNSYTLGRGESYDGGDSNGNISTPADIERSWGRTVNDRTHTFVSSFVYGLPFEKDGWLGVFSNGWQVSGIFTAQSGTPLQITMDGALLRAPGNQQRPDMIGDSEILGGVGTGELWFDTSAFAAPAPNTFGNLTRTGSGLNGPGYVNLDASLVKKFGMGARYGEFRVDAFNVTNSLHPNNPNTGFGSATFGQITGAFESRLIRFGLRFVF